MSQASMLGPEATIAGADAMLEQCATFIGLVGEPLYARPCEALDGGTIGQHVRHSLDHFRAALAGAEGGCVEYDRRERETAIERDPAAALAEIGRLRERLAGIGGAEARSDVVIRVMVSADGTMAELGSSVGRELAFASHHAVHHHAMMGAMARSLGIEPPAGFGKAPATLGHERSLGR